MRVLVSTHYWWPHLGGIERVALQQAEGLAQRGHDVRVLTSRVDGGRSGTESGDEPVHVTRIPAWNGLEPHGVPWPVCSPRLLPAARRLVAWCDVVLAHGSVFLPTVAAAVQARRLSRPFVLFQHSPEIRFHGRLLQQVQRAADASLARWTLRRAASVLTPSACTAEYVRRITGTWPRVLPWGIELEQFAPQPSDAVRAAERRRLGLPADAFLVVGAGRLASKNRFGMLVEAAAGAAGDIPRLHCVILGRGPELSDLRERARRVAPAARVEVPGYVDDDRLRLFLRSADVVVATAGRNEGFGLVVAEALACGVPVVAGHRGGHVDLVREGENGWLFDETVHGLSGALRRAHRSLLAEPRNAWARRARHAVEHLTWERHFAELASVLEDAAAP